MDIVVLGLLLAVALLIIVLAAVVVIVRVTRSHRERRQGEADSLRAEAVVAAGPVASAENRAVSAEAEAERARAAAQRAEQQAEEARHVADFEAARQEDHVREADRIDPAVRTSTADYAPEMPAAPPSVPAEPTAAGELPFNAPDAGSHRA